MLVRLAPDQLHVEELCRALAALVVGVPTLVSGFRGVVKAENRIATAQLVAIAVLADAASGDFITATLMGACSKRGALLALAPPSTGFVRSVHGKP
jgi:hypothetical protein